MSAMHVGSYPAYRQLIETGELRKRVEAGLSTLNPCRACPRLCLANRLEDAVGVCGIARHAKVANYFPHFGEEDCLRGSRGSGTIFFAGCNLRCAFCQNWEISHRAAGEAVSAERLAEQMLELQEKGCHNINWVTPSHVIPLLLEGLLLAGESGLRLPLVYNSSGYDSVEMLRLLDGVVDIYLPDFKFWDSETALRVVRTNDYPEVARSAIREMHRQVGDLVLGRDGLAIRGLLVRHLVLPGGIAQTREIGRWLASEISEATYLNLMDQYRPAGAVVASNWSGEYSDLNRGTTEWEYEAAVQSARQAGLYRFDRLNGTDEGTSGGSLADGARSIGLREHT